MPKPANVFHKLMAHALFVGLEEIPGVGVAVKIGRGWWKILQKAQDQQPPEARIAQLEQAAACSPAEARQAAAEFIAEQRARGVKISPEKEAALLDLLSATPAAVRAQVQDPLRQARRQGTAPHTVLPVTAVFSEADREAFYQSLLPARRPLFHPGEPLPHGNPEWKLQELLGAGGFGEVWLVRQGSLGNCRAVKFCHDAASARVLQREADTLRRIRDHLPKLNHANNLVLLRDLQLIHEPYWLSFEYVEGGTLEGRIRAGACSWDQAKALFTPIVRAMAEVHALGIVHRDLSPANILLHHDTPKITDFGIGKIIAEQASAERRAQTLTTTGYGRIGYMSPEQESGAPAHPADDTYALGGILWQMLAGSLHFPRFEDDVTELAAPQPARQLILACRFQRREKRPRDAAALLGWLETDAPEDDAEEKRRAEVARKRREAEQAAQRKAEAERQEAAAREQREALAAKERQQREAQRRAQAAAEEKHRRAASSGSGGWWVLLVAVLVIGAVVYFQQEKETSPTRIVSAFVEPKSGIKFVAIPEGCFDMGSNNGSSDEKAVHRVCVDAFYMAETEVTQAQWQKVMDNNSSYFKGANRPVENVSWNDAQEFIQRLGGNYRLPTKAEWEYAARAGSSGKYSKDAQGREVTESNLSTYAWYGENWERGHHPVGQKQPNAFGLYDMHGNVWEWVQDWYDSNYYANSPERNPKGPNNGTARVLRGGAWNNGSRHLALGYRNCYDPGDRSNDVGFRVVVRLARTK